MASSNVLFEKSINTKEHDDDKRTSLAEFQSDCTEGSANGIHSIGINVKSRCVGDGSDDIQKLLSSKPLSSRQRELIARSFILGVVMADSTRNRKRKRLLKQETERQSLSSSRHVVTNKNSPEDTFSPFVSSEGNGKRDCFSRNHHPMLQEFNRDVI